MLRNEDRIARPARARFFPLTVPEVVRLIRELGFDSPLYQKRLDIVFRNPDSKGDFGSEVAAFYPKDSMIISSFPEDCDRLWARSLVEVVLREFAELSKRAQTTDRRQKAISFRAYLGPQSRVTITKRTRRATLTKYRGSAKFSRAFKPKGVKTDERIVHSIDVA